MGNYKITPNPSQPYQYDVHYWTTAKGAPLPANTIRTPIGWVEKLNDVPLIKREAEELVKSHRNRLKRWDMILAVVDSIHEACDNGRDMYELDNDYLYEYAIGSIAMEIVYDDKSEINDEDDYMMSGGYVSQHMEYRRKHNRPVYTRKELRPVLNAAILQFTDEKGGRE